MSPSATIDQPPATSPLPTASDSELKDNWSAQVYRTNASFVFSPAFTTPVLGLLAPQPGERVLDLGAGSGELSLEIARAVQVGGAAGTVMGVDMSHDLLARAAELARAQEVGGVEWVERDGHDLEGVGGGFDAAFSNAALHWMKEDPVKVRESGAELAEASGRGHDAGLDVANGGGLGLSQVARNVYDRLNPGGRYAAEMGGQYVPPPLFK